MQPIHQVAPNRLSTCLSNLLPSLLLILLGVSLPGYLSAQIVLNGGFESTGNWGRSGDMYFHDATSNPKNGSYYAYLSATPGGTPGNNLVGAMAQFVTIPAGVNSASVSFWVSITTEETSGAFDFFDFKVSTGPQFTTLLSLDNTDGIYSTIISGPNCTVCQQYILYTIDLSAYIGQSIGLNFSASTDGFLPTMFRVDDVSISTSGIGVCPDPSTLQVGAITSSTAQLSWAGTLQSAWDGYDIRVYDSGGSLIINEGDWSSNSYTATGLQAGETYTWKVRTDCDAGGLSQSNYVFGPSFTTTGSGICPLPTNLQIGTITNTSAQLSWSGSLQSAWDGYDIRVYDSGGSLIINEGDWSSNSYTATGLQAGETYTWKVRTDCDAGGLSQSNYVFGPSFTTTGLVCTVPSSGFNVTALTCSTAIIDWASVSGTTGFDVEVCQVGGIACGIWTVSNSTSGVASLQANTGYQWRVRSNCSGSQTSSWSAWQFFTTPACPSCTPPSGLSSTNISTNSATLNWNTTAGVLDWTVRWKVTGSSSWITTQTTSNNQINATGLTANTSYTWEVRANCLGGTQSAWTSSSFVTNTSGVCSVPNNLQVSVTNCSTATATWNAVSSALNYEARICFPGGTCGTSVTLSATSSVSNLLSANTTYEYQIRAICGSGNMSNWVVQSFTTPTCTACTSPAGLATNSISTNSATLNWNTTVGVLDWTVRWKVTGGSNWISTQTTSNSQFNVSGLVANTTYVWEVRANCSGGSQSGWTASSFTTLSAQCSAPSGLQVAALSCSTATATWNMNPNAIDYDVQICLGNGVSCGAISSVSGTSVSLPSLVGNTAYQFKVRGDCGGGSISNWATYNFTTPTCPSPTCDPPAWVAASAINCSTATVTWNPVSNAIEYRIQRKKGNGSWGSVAIVSSGTTYMYSNLDDDSDYIFRVRAQCGSGIGNSSYSISNQIATPPCGSTGCGPITNVVINSTQTTAQISWNPVPGATGYEVWWRPNDEILSYEKQTITGTSITLTSYDGTLLFSGGEYEVLLLPICGAVVGNSTLEIFTTLTITGCQPVAKPHVISRHEWLCGKACNNVCGQWPNANTAANLDCMETNQSIYNHGPEYFVIHHTVGGYGNGIPFDPGINPMGWENHLFGSVFCDHVGTLPSPNGQGCRGWPDIGYHYIIDPLGNIYEGVPERNALEYTRAYHAGNENYKAMGIALIGNYGDMANTVGASQPNHSQATYDALANLLAYLCSIYNINPSDFFPNASGTYLPRIRGHRDVPSNKPCPGDGWYDGQFPDMGDFVNTVGNLYCPTNIQSLVINTSIYGSILSGAKIYMGGEEQGWHYVGTTNEFGQLSLVTPESYQISGIGVRVIANGYDITEITITPKNLADRHLFVPVLPNLSRIGLVNPKLNPSSLSYTTDSVLSFKPSALNLSQFFIDGDTGSHIYPVGTEYIYALEVGENNFAFNLVGNNDTIQLYHTIYKYATNQIVDSMKTISIIADLNSEGASVNVDKEYTGKLSVGTNLILADKYARNVSIQKLGYKTLTFMLDSAIISYPINLVAKSFVNEKNVFPLQPNNQNSETSYSALGITVGRAFDLSQAGYLPYPTDLMTIRKLDPFEFIDMGFQPVSHLYQYVIPEEPVPGEKKALRTASIVDQPVSVNSDELYILNRNDRGGMTKIFSDSLFSWVDANGAGQTEPWWSYDSLSQKLTLRLVEYHNQDDDAVDTTQEYLLARRQAPLSAVDTMWIRAKVPQSDTLSTLFLDPDILGDDMTYRLVDFDARIQVVMNGSQIIVNKPEDFADPAWVLLEATHDGLTTQDTLWVMSQGITGLDDAWEGTLISQPYPNPATDEVFIDYDIHRTIDIEINLYDAVGKSILGKSVKWRSGVGTERLDVSAIPSGIYLLQITINDGVLRRVNRLVVL